MQHVSSLARLLPALLLVGGLGGGLGGGLVGGLSGCAYGELSQVLRTEVAAELDCPSVAVEPRNNAALRGTRDGDDQWKVRGCDVVRTYTCPAEADEFVTYGHSGCTYVDGDVDAPEMATDESADLLSEPTDGVSDDADTGLDDE